MNTPLAFPALSAAIAPIACGFVIALALVWAVWLGIRIRQREPGPPDPAEQPKLPASGPVHEIQEVREPDEVPTVDDHGARLTPHRLRGHGNMSIRRSANQTPRRWRGDSGGGLGSGGTGRP
ncbi:DUF6479 family protein [Streptomyces sp. NPDC050085]|uniref:DUF6479 family protein n=1 Tax=Streptomyces sp. NPDC050085 TaxID=3365600 RepID=UPI003798B0C9